MTNPTRTEIRDRFVPLVARFATSSKKALIKHDIWCTLHEVLEGNIPNRKEREPLIGRIMERADDADDYAIYCERIIAGERGENLGDVY